MNWLNIKQVSFTQPLGTCPYNQEHFKMPINNYKKQEILSFYVIETDPLSQKK